MSVDTEDVSMASPYYWVGVLALSAIFAFATTVVANERAGLLLYRVATIVCLLPWIGLGTLAAGPLFFGSLNADPRWPPLWTGLPVALVVGVLAILAGGYTISGLIGARRTLIHPWRLLRAWKSRPPEPGAALSQADVQAAEAYDAEWQTRDRERNRRLGTGPRL